MNDLATALLAISQAVTTIGQTLATVTELTDELTDEQKEAVLRGLEFERNLYNAQIEKAKQRLADKAVDN